jgi:hypothetical protein
VSVEEILDWILKQEGDNLRNLGRAVHDALDPSLRYAERHPRLAFWHPFCWFWRIWWRVGYRWIYPFMWRARFRGCAYAQFFGGELTTEAESELRWRFASR